MSEVLTQMSEKMKKSLETYRKEISKFRTGRASISLLDDIYVETYGTSMPLNQVATLTIPESRQIVIQPWDPQTVPAIEKAIMASNIGLTPVNDGKIIRVTIPELTEETRKQLAKQLKQTAEDYKVAIRNLRREALDTLKKQKKKSEISEDDLFKFQDEAQAETDKFISEIDTILKEKEKEILEV